MPPSVFHSGSSLRRLMQSDSSGGIAMMGAAVMAMVVANSPLRPLWDAVLQVPLGVDAGDFAIRKPLLLWINDGLMALFFLVVGLELKREVVGGHLSTLRLAALPGIAAAGGMLVPALIYAMLNHGDPAALRGWAIPTATDIAFALGVLSLLGRRVPPALKVFLLSVAIFDDLGAIVIIAAFYTAELSVFAMSMAGLMLLILLMLNRTGVRRLAPYLLAGAVLWAAVLKSGVHATLAGVAIALFIPQDKDASRETKSPAMRLEHALYPWVTFFVLPLFALANAGVTISHEALRDLAHPVSIGIAAGLFFGKQLGIMLAVGLAVRGGFAALPPGTGWRQVYGVAVLCGIGFTMSLFIASLAFEGSATAYSGLDRLGILAGTILSGIVGYLVLHTAARSHSSPE